MSAKRLYQVLGAIALVALLTLAGRSAFGAIVPHLSKTAGNEAQAKSLGSGSASRSYMAGAKAAEEQQKNAADHAFRTPQTSNYTPVDRSFHTPQTADYTPIDRSFHTPQTSNYQP